MGLVRTDEKEAEEDRAGEEVEDGLGAKEEAEELKEEPLLPAEGEKEGEGEDLEQEGESGDFDAE